MARTNKVEACIFCMSLPCTCNKQDKPAPKAKAKAKDSEAPKPKSRFKPTSARPSPPPVESKPDPTPTTRFAVEEAAESQDELEFKQAIRNLAPILKDVERVRYRNIISPPKPANVERRLIEWRQRRAEAGDIPSNRED